MLKKSGRWLLLYLAIIVVMAFLFIRLPTSFLPLEDLGVFLTQVQLPAGATLQQTSSVVAKVEDYYMTHEKDNVLSVFSTIGAGPGGNGQNVARLFVRLKDWGDRPGADRTSFAIIERATKAFQKIKEGRVIASSPPAISGMGSSSGFDLQLQDHAGIGHTQLMAMRDKLLEMAGKDSALSRVRHNGLDDSPQLQIDVDERKAQALGVSIDTINDTLTTAWGSTYVNDFLDRGRVKKSTYRQRLNIACCLAILINGMPAAAAAAWCLSPPLRPAAGKRVHPAWSVTMAIPLWRLWVKPLLVSAAARRWTRWRSW